ncbi:MAG: 5-(carboxyamino)imidazole ribonucleotide synthase [Cryomorphaceae bacterium]|nr:5-(carboxyamino)imidazole ribonucleotide synthase [Cryomorphaceae bacterium]
MDREVPFSGKVKLGILGGGQLGKMIIDEVMRYDIYIGVIDPSDHPPAGTYANQTVKGSFRNYDEVMAFGKDYDVLTIEIEDVNTDALRDLEAQGVRVYPQPAVIDIFRDKCVQKQFYADCDIPTSDFTNYTSKPDSIPHFPFVWKAATGGYDGKGVQVVKNQKDWGAVPNQPCVIEQLVSIHKEIGVIVHRNAAGEIATFAPVEMEFHPTANLVELVFAPADLPENLAQKCEAIAQKLAEKTEIVGTLAVELFIDAAGNVLVNECAPRVHNSGHLSIEACYTSQFEQHVRAILNMPLGDTTLILPAAMGNVVGEEGYTGLVKYNGADDLLQTRGTYLHLYGKTETRPFRKMGHITCIDPDLDVARENVRNFRRNFKITSTS